MKSNVTVDIHYTKKSFPLRISSVNVTKSAQYGIIPGFLMFSVSFTEEILNAKLHFLVQ